MIYLTKGCDFMALKTYILSSLAKVFLDEEPKNYIELNKISAFRNEKIAFQLAVSSDECTENLFIEISEKLNIYKVISVPSIKAATDETDEYYLRTTPGLYPDVLKPYDNNGFRMASGAWISFWFEGENLDAGEHNIEIKIKDKDGEVLCTKNVTLDIIDACLPEQTLIHTNWFHCDSLATYYNVEVFSDKFWEITENFVKTAVEHGINFILTPLFTPPLDTKIGGERLTVQLVGVKKTESGYEFDFSNLVKWIEMCKRCGVKYYEMSHLFTQWGALHSPKIIAEVDGEEKRIFGWETDSVGEEYTEFLTSLAPELTKVLEENEIADYTYFHVSDEPGENDLEVYAKASATTHKLFGKRFKVLDALSEFEFFEKGYVTTPVPSEHAIENFVGKVPELWVYYCCGPTDNFYSNRFLSMPLQRTRIIGMQMYKYGVQGFLHWGYNFYFTQLSVRKVNPFAETDADCAFSSGDAFVVYPGDDGKAWASIRLKAMNEAFQDMRALQMLEKLIGKEEVVKILENNNGENFNMSFTEYPRSEEWHILKREDITNKIRELI